MQIVQASTATDRPNPHGVRSQIMLDRDTAQVVLITINPGQGMQRHTTPVDVFFYVVEGTGWVEIGEEQAEVGAGTLVDSPAGIPHRLWNEGEAAFRFLVVKTPHP